MSLAGLVGLYITAMSVHLTWAFWAVVAAAALVSIVTIIGPRILTWAEYIKKYPALLEAAGKHQVENSTLRSDLRASREESESQWSAGIAEGRREFYGGILSQQADKIPDLIGVDLTSEGSPVLIAQWSSESAVLGARFNVEAKNTGALRGIVEAIQIDSDRNVVSLLCIRPTSEKFWSHITQRAEFDTTPPADVELAPSSVGDDSFNYPILRETEDRPTGVDPVSTRE